jgi:hypothetical protein
MFVWTTPRLPAALRDSLAKATDHGQSPPFSATIVVLAARPAQPKEHVAS